MKSGLLYFVLVLIFINTNVHGEESDVVTGNTASGQNVKPSKVHTLDFEDELIEGGIQKPDLFYLIQRKNFNFKKLVRLRENFLPEMRETADNLKKGRK